LKQSKKRAKKKSKQINELKNAHCMIYVPTDQFPYSV